MKKLELDVQKPDIKSNYRFIPELFAILLSMNFVSGFANFGKLMPSPDNGYFLGCCNAASWISERIGLTRALRR